MSDEQASAVDAADDGAEPPSESDTDVAEPTGEESDTEPPTDSIADRIDGENPASVAEEIVTLREEVAALRTERDELESKLKRKQAEFQNYKKRQRKQRERERERATEDLVEELLEVRDNLSRALEQDGDADIREGVEATFRGLESVLEGEGVEPIEPAPGTETDPKRHEVLLRVESDEPAGTVADIHRPGYEMAGKVLRAAQVTVSDGPEGGSGADGGSEVDDSPGTHNGSEAGNDTEADDSPGDDSDRPTDERSDE